jgi:DNA-binding transcriptional regulator YhcF (GntR family)
MSPPPPLVHVDLSSPLPVYRQIADAIRAHLFAGRFQEGDQLPPARELAMDLSVNHNTVVQGYRILAEEGWLELGRRRGATVRARPERRARPEAKAGFSRKLEQLVAQAVAHGLSAAEVAELLATHAKRLRGQEKER